jgi:hypothetical protein
MQPPDRRKTARRRLIEHVDCREVDAVCLGKSVDVSEGGLLIAAERPLCVGTTVEVRFAVPVFPQAVSVQAQGTVVRATHDSMAIQFTTLDAVNRETINSWGRQMLCKSCRSEKLGKFVGEIAIHFTGLNNIDKPAVWVFPNVVVCLDCGISEFDMPEDELRLLVAGGE